MALPAIKLLYATNDTAAGGDAPGPGLRYEADIQSFAASGNFTASTTNNFIFVPNYAGVITNVVLACQGGVDVTNPLNLTATVKKNGTAVCTTDPKIDKTAGTGTKTTYAAGTGITQPVLKGDGTQQFVAGDAITVDLTLVRTASPGTEIAAPCVLVYFQKYAN